MTARCYCLTRVTLSISPLAAGYAAGGPIGQLQSFANGVRQQTMLGVFGPDDTHDARSMLDCIADEVFRLSLEDHEYFEGELVAGYPAQRLQAMATDPNSGLPYSMDVGAFEK